MTVTFGDMCVGDSNHRWLLTLLLSLSQCTASSRRIRYPSRKIRGMIVSQLDDAEAKVFM